MEIFDKDFREIFSSQLISIIGGLIAGTLIGVFREKILLIPGMIILLPGFLEMRGNISGTFAARLSSGLFLGVIDPKKYNTKIIRGNLLASFVLALTVSLVLGLVAYSVTYLTMGISYPKIIAMPFLAGIIANAIEIMLTLFATFYLFRKGLDPNNIMGPFVTSTGDISSVFSLLIVMLII